MVLRGMVARRVAVHVALLCCCALSAPACGTHIQVQHRRGAAAASSVSDPPTWYNKSYSYPDGAGALIIEGPFPYQNGPPVWSDDTPFGAFGMIVMPGTYDREDPEAGCTAVPPSSPFASSSSVRPVKMTDGIHDCLLGCNITDVSATGVDPCHAGSLPKGAGLSNSVMSCFNLGPGTEGHGGGACGYNCTLLKPNGTNGQLIPCTKANVSKCEVVCDTRTLSGEH
jgi:hypothetical protein